MPIRNPLALVALLLSCALATPAQAADTPHWVHYRLLNKSATLPKKVVVIPASVKVFEVTAGGVEEEVPDWSNEASSNVLKAVSSAFTKKAGMQEITMPRLPAAETAIVNEHMALYQLVVNTAAGSGLKHKLRHFDYGIGPGLAALLSKTGADAVVMVYGRDYASTAGRKTKAVLGKIPIVNIFTGGEVALGHSFIHIGLIDLKTGDLLWMNSKYDDGSSNLRAYDDAEDMVADIFKWYPGIEKYRDAYVK
jgi:hypothetical protein